MFLLCFCCADSYTESLYMLTCAASAMFGTLISANVCWRHTDEGGEGLNLDVDR